MLVEDNRDFKTTSSDQTKEAGHSEFGEHSKQQQSTWHWKATLRKQACLLYPSHLLGEIAQANPDKQSGRIIPDSNLPQQLWSTVLTWPHTELLWACICLPRSWNLLSQTGLQLVHKTQWQLQNHLAFLTALLFPTRSIQIRLPTICETEKNT